ncbi:hypothetical protein ACFX16_009359 [Malus domestica]
MYTLSRFFGFWSESLPRSIAKKVLQNFLGQGTKEILDVGIPPVGECAGIVSFWGIRLKAKFSTPFLEFSLNLLRAEEAFSAQE